MSINLIQSSSSKQPQKAGSLANVDQAASNSTASQVALYNATLGNTKDSISISSAASLQINSQDLGLLESEQAFIINAYEAKNSVGSVVSILQNNGSHILHSMRGLTSAVVLNLISE